MRMVFHVHGGRFIGPVVMAAMLALLAVGPAEGATTTPLNKNLVKDPGAEAAAADGLDGSVIVAIPGWTTVNGFTAAAYGTSGCPTTEQAAAIHGGKHIFFGGPDSAQSTAIQNIKIIGRNTAIDHGKLKVTLSAWLGGWDGQGDNAQLVVRFLRGNGTQISSVKTAAVAGTSSVLKHKTASKGIPKGTRTLRVMLVSTRIEGMNNDGMFDNIDVRIKLK